MMNKFVYAVRDLKTTFLSPFVEVNDEAAKRGFFYSISNQPDIIGFAPKDFSLYRIGSFDTMKGTLVADPIPVLVAEAFEMYQKEPVHEE